MSSSTGVKKNAFQNWGTATGNANTAGANASGIYSGLEPTYAAEAAHPPGYTPQQKSAFDTAAQQSAGGGMSGAVGQGALLAARTRNAGAAQNAIQQAGRQSREEIGDAGLKTEMANANLQQRQKEQAREGLQGLYNTNVQDRLKSLGLSDEFLNTLNNAKPSFWQQMAQTAGKNLVNAGMDSAEAFAGF